MQRILILGGTLEARRLAGRLAGRDDLAVTLSLAGRTLAPAAQPVPVRVGGFGGAQGLAAYLREQHIDGLIDATHPYAALISANAVSAAKSADIPLLALRRPPWTPQAGDHWSDAADAVEAVRLLGREPRRVFLALGRKELAPFEEAPQHHYVVRSVDPIEPMLKVPDAIYVLGRGPFTQAADYCLLAGHRINVVVAKNSGGEATYGKIAAARELGIAVIVLRRPTLPAAPAVETIDATVAWIDHTLFSRIARGV